MKRLLIAALALALTGNAYANTCSTRQAGATDQTVYVTFLDATTGVPNSSLAFNSSGIDIEYVRTGATAVDITEATQTTNGAHADGGFVSVGHGRYRLDLPDAAVAAGVPEVVIQGIITGYILAPCTVALSPPVNVVSYGGTAGTFSSGRPEVNTTHAAGTAWGSGAITAASIATDAIGSAEVADDSIDAGAIAASAIGASELATGAITTAEFASGAIDAAAIAADAIGASELAADAIGASELASAAIAADEIATDAIGAAEVAAGAIAADAFASGAIDATAIAADAIGASEIATDAIGAAEIAASAIAASEIAADAITAAKFDSTAGAYAPLKIVDQGTAQSATGTTLVLRSAAAFADDELIGAHIVITGGSTGVGQSKAITDYVQSTDTATVSTWTVTPTGTITYKIFAEPAGSGGAVSISAGGITSSSFASGAIDAAAIAADAIGASELAADAIAASEIAADAIGASELATDAIGAAEIAASAVAAAEIADGAIDEATFATTAGAFASLGIVDQGTAQAATGTTLQLRSAAAFADDEIIGATCLITSGSAGVGQARTVTDYVSSTDTATVDTWTTTPTGTILYKCFGTASSSGGAGASAADVWAYATRSLTILDEDSTTLDLNATFVGGVTTFDEDTTTIDINATTLGTVTTATTATTVTTVNGFASGAITATAIATDAIGAAEIADGAIDSGAFASAAITAASIATDAIGAAEIASAAIAADEIATDAIGAAEVAVGAIAADAFASGAIDATAIAADAIGASELAADAIAASEFATTAADEITDNVWNEAQAGHVSAGTFGAYLDSSVSGVSTGGVSAGDIADAVWDEATSGHTTSGTFGEQLKTDVDAILVDTGTTLDTAIADLPTNAELATALGTADDAVLTAVGDVPTNAELATALGTADDAVLAAIAALNNLSAAQLRDTVIEDQGSTISLGCALAAILAYAGGDVVTSGANSTYEDPSGTETRIAGTVSSGSRVGTITCPTY